MKKSLKFEDHLASLIISGEKTTTWRLFDDKDLQVGDIVSLIDNDKDEIFGEAEIVKITEKPFGDITDEDFEGHEKFESKEKMYETYKGYYGDRVNSDSIVKTVKFKLTTK